MTVSETKLSELADLLARLCDSELDRPEWERLDALLLDDTDAQEFYRRFIALDVNLAWRGADRAASGPADAPTPERFLAKKESRPASSALPVTLPSDRAALVVGSSSIFGSLLGSPALAYAVTALVLALGIIGARLWSPPGDGQQGAGQQGDGQQLAAGDVLPPPTVAGRAPVVVGRITATSGCQWANPQTAPREGEPVFQGRSFLLNSGLLEISYEIGTKAILEGPAVYKVDAANGGSLFFGKVTVHASKVARPAAVAGGRAEGAGHGQVAAAGRLTPPPRAAAFCVRTGSALVKNTGAQTRSSASRSTGRGQRICTCCAAWLRSARPASSRRPCRPACASGRGRGRTTTTC